MGIGSGTALLIGGLASAGGSIASGVLGSNAANNAASTQANAANQAAALQYASGQNALAFQNYIFQQQQANQRPWLQQGQNALNLLARGVGLTPQATQQAAGEAAQEPQPTTITPPPGITNSYQQSAQDQLGKYQGQSFDQLVHSGDPNVSPNAQTTQAWMAQGIPFQNVTTPDGRTVAVRINPLASLSGGTASGGVAPGAGSPATGTPPAGTQNAFADNAVSAATPRNAFAQADPKALAALGGGGAQPRLGTGDDASATGPNGQPINTIPAAGTTGGPQEIAPGIGINGLPINGAGSVQNNTNAFAPSINGVPGAPNAFAALTDFTQPGALTAAYPYQFQAPTGATEQNDPGYQFRLQQGLNALQASASASGTLLAGGTGRALEEYGQDYASNEYGNVYNRALTNYQNAYNQFQQGQSNAFNRLAAISGVGQTAAGQLNSSAAQAGNGIANTLTGNAAAIGQQLNNAAAARGSGYVGSANAINGAIGGGTNSLLQLLLLHGLQGGGGGLPGIGASNYGVDG